MEGLTQRFVIPHELMDLNKFVDKQRGNKFGGASAKKQQTELCALYIRKAINKGLKITQYPINIKFTWVMKNRRKDKDNISFSKKFVLDGMQSAGLIKNDGWNEINNFQDRFKVDKSFPRVEVEISYPSKEEVAE